MLRPLGVHVCLRVAQLSLAQTELERGVALRTRALAAVVTAWPYRGQVRGDGATMWMEKRSDHGEMSERFLESMTSQGRRHAPGDDGGLGPTVRRFVALPGLRRHPPPHRLDDLAHTHEGVVVVHLPVVVMVVVVVVVHLSVIQPWQRWF